MPTKASSHTFVFCERPTWLKEIEPVHCDYMWEKVWSGMLLSLCVSLYYGYTSLVCRYTFTVHVGLFRIKQYMETGIEPNLEFLNIAMCLF